MPLFHFPSVTLLLFCTQRRYHSPRKATVGDPLGQVLRFHLSYRFTYICLVLSRLFVVLGYIITLSLLFLKLYVGAIAFCFVLLRSNLPQRPHQKRDHLWPKVDILFPLGYFFIVFQPWGETTPPKRPIVNSIAGSFGRSSTVQHNYCTTLMNGKRVKEP